MAFTLEKTGTADITIVGPESPGAPYKAQFRMTKTTSRMWLYLLFTKDTASLALTIWTRNGAVAPTPVILSKRDGSGAIVDEAITLGASKDCKIPIDIGLDTDMVEVRIVPTTTSGSDLLKIGFALE